MKQLLTTILLLSTIWSIAQKSQSVKVKAKTGVLKVAAKVTQPLQIQVNGKVIYSQALEVPKRVLLLKDFSDWRIAFNTAITDSVILQGETLQIESDCIPEQHIPFDGDLTLQGTSEKPLVITCTFREGIDQPTHALYFGAGKHHFKNVIFKKIGSNPFGSCIQTTQADITYHNTFENCKWEGDWAYNYQSSTGRGSSTFTECEMFAVVSNIHYFSQLGSKDLVMKNTTVKSLTSHNIYSHSWNNYYIDGLTSLGCGSNAFNSYFTKNTGNFKSTYQSFKNCKNSPEAISTRTGSAPMWRMQSVGSRISVENSNLPVYEWNRDMDLINTNTTNHGNGTPIYGNSAAINSTGELTAMDTLTVISSKLNSFIGWHNSTATVINTSITYTTLKPGKYLFKNCSFFDITIEGESVNVTFENCTFNSQYKAIRLRGSLDNIKFIGNIYPIIKY